MRLSILQENLAKGLSIVGRAVSSRSTLPVLGNILLSTDDGRLKLAATNLEVGVSCWLGAQVEDDGAITLPARLLTEWVGSVPAEKINLEMVVRTMSVNLKCARFESNIKGIDASEFPLIPTADGERSLGLPPATLRKIIDQVAFAAADAKDTSRPSLTGVLARFEGDRLTLAATDGYRLSVRRTILPMPAPADHSVIIPARSLQEVSRISGECDPDQPVELAVAAARNQILFRMKGRGEGEKGAFHQVDLVSQLIDAKFPDYNAIIPKNYTTRTVIDTAAFQRALKVASLFARDASDRCHVPGRPRQRYRARPDHPALHLGRGGRQCRRSRCPRRRQRPRNRLQCPLSDRGALGDRHAAGRPGDVPLRPARRLPSGGRRPRGVHARHHADAVEPVG